MSKIRPNQVSLLTNPVWVIKTRLQLQRSGAGAAAGPAYKGLADAARQIWVQEGLRGFYHGLLPSLLLVWFMRACASAWNVHALRAVPCLHVRSARRTAQHPPPPARPNVHTHTHTHTSSSSQVSHGAVQFMVYEELKALVARANGQERGTPPRSAPVIAAMGAVSKLCATVVTYPSQVCA